MNTIIPSFFLEKGEEMNYTVYVDSIMNRYKKGINEMSNQKKEVKSLPPKYVSLPTKSSMIRSMSLDGWGRGDIGRTLSEHFGTLVRYQHVRNVLITPLKKK